MENIINSFNNIVFKCLVIVVFLDVFLGTIRALKAKKWNSTVGINGILRKVSMIGSSVFLIILDKIINIDLLFFVPKQILNVLKINKVGTFELFGIMFILYEITSILKNMLLCGLPIPNKIKGLVENMLKEMTEELDTKGGEKSE